MPGVKDINGISQRNRAYDLLRRALLLRQIPGGQRLRELDWAERLGVNRTALREACGRLCAEGLIVDGPKGGYFTARWDTTDILEVLEIRIMLETAAIERICRLDRNKPKHMKPVCDACDDLEWLLRKGYAAQLEESDQRFHETLISIAGSKRLAFLYRCVPPTGSCPEIGGERLGGSSGQIMLKEHRDILASILKGRTGEAQRLLRSHLAEKLPVSSTNGVGVA